MRAAFKELGYPADAGIPDLIGRVAQASGTYQGEQIVKGYEAIIQAAERDIAPAFDLRPQARVIVIGGRTGGYGWLAPWRVLCGWARDAIQIHYANAGLSRGCARSSHPECHCARTESAAVPLIRMQVGFKRATEDVLIGRTADAESSVDKIVSSFELRR